MVQIDSRWIGANKAVVESAEHTQTRGSSCLNGRQQRARLCHRKGPKVPLSVDSSTKEMRYSTGNDGIKCAWLCMNCSIGIEIGG